jgi:hypothetical protein
MTIHFDYLSYIHRYLMMTETVWPKHVAQVTFTLNK